MPLPDHILAGFIHGLRHRKRLAALLDATEEGCCVNLDPARLKAAGIAALALDFDGVLAPHGFSAPIPAIRAWLVACTAEFGEENIFILSNKPTEERRLWFATWFPGMRFIGDVPKKPFPDGINRIAELADVAPACILMIDDRLLTGCLAAINAGARPAYVRKPYHSLRHRPLTELFFMLLRWGERVFVRLAALF